MIAIQDKIIKNQRTFFSTVPSLLVGHTKIDYLFSTMQHIVLNKRITY